MGSVIMIRWYQPTRVIVGESLCVGAKREPEPLGYHKNLRQQQNQDAWWRI